MKEISILTMGISLAVFIIAFNAVSNWIVSRKEDSTFNKIWERYK